MSPCRSGGLRGLSDWALRRRYPSRFAERAQSRLRRVERRSGSRSVATRAPRAATVAPPKPRPRRQFDAAKPRRIHRRQIPSRSTGVVFPRRLAKAGPRCTSSEGWRVRRRFVARRRDGFQFPQDGVQARPNRIRKSAHREGASARVLRTRVRSRREFQEVVGRATADGTAARAETINNRSWRRARRNQFWPTVRSTACRATRMAVPGKCACPGGRTVPRVGSSSW